MADFYMPNIFDANRGAVRIADHDLADVFGVSQEPQSANIVKLLPDGIKTAAGIGVIGGECRDYLRHRDVEIVEARRVEQHLVLHSSAAKAGIVGYARHRAVCALDNPILESLQFLRRAVRTLEDVAVHQTAGAEEWRHAGCHATRERGVGEALKRQLAREVSVGTLI